MTWAVFTQFILAVLLGGWLKSGKSAIPGHQLIDKLGDVIAKRIKGKNGTQDVPELPRVGP